MSFRVSGKNIDIGEALRERINSRIVDALQKYFDGGYSGHATIGKEAFGFHTECVLHLDSGVVLNADAMAADPYLSADQAAENLEKRLRRYHRKLKDYRISSRANGRLDGDLLDDSSVASTDDSEQAELEESADGPAVIAETMTSLKQLSVSEAVTELDTTGASAMAFRHAGHGRVNVVYRRADGHIGWIDPPVTPANAH
jgi:ribosomal subunit interface protein